MARYTGPRARVSRRLGTNIWGTRGETVALFRGKSYRIKGHLIDGTVG